VVEIEEEMVVEMVDVVDVVEEVVAADLSPRNPVPQHTSKCVPASPSRAVGLYRGRNAQQHPNNNVALCPSNNADLFQDK